MLHEFWKAQTRGELRWKHRGVKAKTSPTSREILDVISQQEAEWVYARIKEAMQIAGQGRAAV
jgi:hypothetical protein